MSIVVIQHSGSAWHSQNRSLGESRPPVAHHVYVARRIAVTVLVSMVACLATLGVHTALADRGAVPASTPAVRQSSAALAATALVGPGQYMVQPNDTMWKIAALFSVDGSIADYVDRLVVAHGGSSVLQVGEVLTLP